MNPHAAANPRPDRREQDAFTFTDLLVVLGVVTLLALLSLTALAHNQPSSERAGCANNLRRLMQAWQMYADDYSGLLIANSSLSGSHPWVGGLLDFSPGNPDNTSALKLTNSTYAAIGPYVSSSSLFRCPSDPSTLNVSGMPKLRVRSYSISDVMGPIASGWNPSYQSMTKLSEVSQPERTYVLLEEHPGSIGDGSIVLPLENANQIIDFPAAFHFGGANLGMADGHVDYWQWTDSRTMVPVMGVPLPKNYSLPGDSDFVRLQAAGGYRR